MSNNLEGYLMWDIHSFDRFIIRGEELVLDNPFQMRVMQKSDAARIDMITGTSINQGFYLGGNAPIQVRAMAFDMSFDFGAKEDMFKINRIMKLAARASQSFFPAYWIEEVFHIPSNLSSSEFRLSRYFPYATVSKSQYMPEVYADETQLTVISTGSPTLTEALIPNTDSDIITVHEDLDAAYLFVRYPPLFYLNTVEVEVDIPEEVGTWESSVSATEHLANKNYQFTVP